MRRKAKTTDGTPPTSRWRWQRGAKRQEHREAAAAFEDAVEDALFAYRERVCAIEGCEVTVYWSYRWARP